MTKNQLAGQRRGSVRFSLGTLLGLFTAFCLFFGIETERARTQRQAVERITRWGNYVAYDYEPSIFDPGSFREAEPPSPKVLRDVLGLDFFHHVQGVVIGDTTLVSTLGVLFMTETGRLSPSEIEEVSSFPHLRNLVVAKSVDAKQLAALAELTNLERIQLYNYIGSESDLARIRQQHPGLKIDLLDWDKP